MNKRLDFVVDGKTIQLIDQLKVAFAAPTAEDVLRKSLALTKAVADAADSNGHVQVYGRGGEANAITLDLRG